MNDEKPALRILNQMAGPMTWELAVDLAAKLGPVDVLTGHPDTLAKGSQLGVRLHRANAYSRGSNLRRFASWFRYTIHAGLWLLCHGRSAPVLVFSNPPIAIWMCWLLSRLFGIRYAVMVHDVYPDTIERMRIVSRTNPISRIWRALNRLAYQRAEVVMTLGEHMANHVVRQFDPAKTLAGKVIIIDPWADASELGNHSKVNNWFAQKHGQTDKLTVMYSGNMGRGHDMESILTAADALSDQPDVAFLLIGAGPKWETIRRHFRDRQPKNVTLLPWQPEGDLPYTLTTADLGLVSLEKELTGLAVPSKTFYFLAAGVPIVAICEPETELADVIDEFRCGRVVAPGNVDEILQAIGDVLRDPDMLVRWKTGARIARERFSRQRNTTRFFEALCQHLLSPVAMSTGSRPTAPSTQT